MKKVIIIAECILILLLIFSCSSPGSEGSSEEKDSGKRNITEIIKKTEITPSDIDTNGTAKLKVFLKDDSPEINYICIYLYSPRKLLNDEGIFLWESLNYDNAEKCFNGNININNYHESGTWKFGEIRIEDINNNIYTYEINPDYSKFFYTISQNSEDQYKLTKLQINELIVKNTTPDLYSPELKSYALEPDIINGNGRIIITINAKDNDGGSGISDVYAGIKTEYNDVSQSILTSGFYDSDKNLYICNITLGNSDQKGKWYIDEIELRDHAGNYTSYKYDNHKSSRNLIRYLSDKEDNYEVTGFDIKGIIKN